MNNADNTSAFRELSFRSEASVGSEGAATTRRRMSAAEHSERGGRG